MTIDEAREHLARNYEAIERLYKEYFGDIMAFANPRVENVTEWDHDGSTEITISCHYDGYDDYNDECENPDCDGGCDICGNKLSWDFGLIISADSTMSIC